MGLGAVAAIGLKGTLRHDRNSCGKRQLLHKTLAIAAISEYTLTDVTFTAKLVHLSGVEVPQTKLDLVAIWCDACSSSRKR
jgi:hypothetical protein